MKGENWQTTKMGNGVPREGRRFRVKLSGGGDFLTVGELEKMLGISDKSIRKMLQRGIMPGLWIAGKWRVPRGVFEQWLSDRIGARYDGRSDGATDRSDGSAGGVSEGVPEGCPSAGLSGGEGEVNLKASASNTVGGTLLHTNRKNAKK